MEERWKEKSTNSSCYSRIVPLILFCLLSISSPNSAHPPANRQKFHLMRLDGPQLDQLKHILQFGEMEEEDGKMRKRMKMEEEVNELRKKRRKEVEDSGEDEDEDGKEGMEEEIGQNMHYNEIEQFSDTPALCRNTAGKKRIERKVHDFLLAEFHRVWSDQHFGVRVLGMNVTIHSLRIRHIQMPKIHVHLPCGTSSQPLAVTVTGGAVSLRAHYLSAYRTLRRGRLHIRLRGFETDWQHRPRQRRKCAERQSVVRQVRTRFRPPLLDEVNAAVHARLRKRVAHVLCERMHAFVGSIGLT